MSELPVPCCCASPPPASAFRLSRRGLLHLLSAGGIAATLPGCDQVQLPFRLVSENQLAAMGLQSWQQIKANTPASSNRSYQAAAQQIADRLLRAARLNPAEWEVQVFSSQQVNAFALPGKRIGIYDGMFQVTESAGQMAAVVGHEIGHVQAEHSRARIEAEMIRNFGVQLIQIALDIKQIAYSREIAALLGLGAEYGLVRPYGRQQELEADRLGLSLMAQAGYRPEDAVALWRRMQERGGQAANLGFLSTHPAPADRVKALEALIQQQRGA